MAQFQISTLAPVYEHDCDRCIYIATITMAEQGQAVVYDLYTCANGETVIARWSDYGPDYKSGMAFAHQQHSGNVLRLAAELAVFRGIIESY